MSTSRAAIGAALLLGAGCVAFQAFVIVVFEVGNRNLALLALLGAGLGVVLGVTAATFWSAGKEKVSMWVLAAAFLAVGAALIGVLSIPTHGE